MITTKSTITQSNDEIINNFKKEYDQIKDCLYNYDKKVINSANESNEGKQIIGYYDKNNIKLIEVLSFGETGKRKIEYYFNKEQLFFVYDSDYRYNRPIYWNEKEAKKNNDSESFDIKKTTSSEDMYYFYNGQLIRWIRPNGKYGDSKLAYYKNLEIQIPNHANEMKKKLNK
ncbi:hypothetical protein [uncultured Lacinutrix sp.]|uniref:hypothetical protein n=1 Tax=uncultured Lacinutrix sp. TaxID=574032 RepID=UPI002635EA50|nr:hypothetical protein [uncultured Lacinutrix sp.]